LHLIQNKSVMNKKEISMKKGQKVRILRTNQVATIVEVELIRKGGKVHRYCHLKTNEKSYLWLDASELGSVVEEVKVSVVDDWNRELHLLIRNDYFKNKMDVQLTQARIRII
jgi:hypothetical protein